jgi:DnaJ-class molecular chaperone
MVPPGVQSGYTQTFPGAGDAADDSTQPPGDLIVELAVEEHPFLRRQGTVFALLYFFFEEKIQWRF